MKSQKLFVVPQDDAEFDQFINAQWPTYELPADFSTRCMRAIALAHDQKSRRRRWLFDFDLGTAFVQRALWLSAAT